MTYANSQEKGDNWVVLTESYMSQWADSSIIQLPIYVGESASRRGSKGDLLNVENPPNNWFSIFCT